MRFTATRSDRNCMPPAYWHSIASGFSSGFVSLLLARFLTGAGLGGALPNLSVPKTSWMEVGREFRKRLGNTRVSAIWRKAAISNGVVRRVSAILFDLSRGREHQAGRGVDRSELPPPPGRPPGGRVIGRDRLSAVDACRRSPRPNRRRTATVPPHNQPA